MDVTSLYKYKRNVEKEYKSVVYFCSSLIIELHIPNVWMVSLPLTGVPEKIFLLIRTSVFKTQSSTHFLFMHT